jgi:hypothetical protein
LDIQSIFMHAEIAPTLFVGISNTFGYQETDYTGTFPGFPTPQTVPVLTPNHTYTFYTGVRLGNRAFRSLLPQGCGPTPKRADFSAS